jgi:methyltransferase (TIGR00027 family)
MQDAERTNPICGDIFAKQFMDDDGLRILDAFKDEARPNASNVARHRIIDDLLRNSLISQPNLSVVIIGAGFDSRAFRLQGGIWVECDEPQVIAYKNERLPAANCPNELHRISIDFSNDSLEEKLSVFANQSSVVVIIEGVFLYLEQGAIRELLQTLQRLFPEHKLICDLMTREFFENVGKSMHEKLTGMGASVKLADSPDTLFLGNGYKLEEKIAIIEKSVVFEAPEIPASVLESIVPTLPRGYDIYVFESP